MDTKPKTLEAFRQSMKPMLPDKAAELLSTPRDQFSDDAPAIFVSPDLLYVECLKDGRFFTLIERDSFTGNFPKVTGYLYFGWYASECCVEWDEATLVTLLNDFAEWSGLTPASADEMLHDLVGPDMTAEATRHANWLQWFIDTWNDVVG